MKKSRSISFGRISLTTVAALVVAIGVNRSFSQQTPGTPSDLEVLPLRPNYFVIAGGGANVSVQFGEDGVVLVDSGSSENSARILAAVKKITAQPIRYIINTGPDADNVGGNAALSKAGLSLSNRANAVGETGATILARLEVLNRMSAPTGKVPPFPVETWPTETFFDKQKALYLNGEGIQVITLSPAHSDADSMVYFRRSDVIAVGDIIDSRRFPVINIEANGSIQGELEALNRLVEMAIPSIPLVYKSGGTLIVPGHGRIFEQADVVEYRDMITIIRDVVQQGIKDGMTLEQIQRSAPASGYRLRYGSESGTWTTNQFVEAIYKSLPR